MKTLTKIAKCAGCCPDVAATRFEAVGSQWECTNCFHKMPRRKNNPTPKITPSQKKILDLLAGMGWELKTEFVGRKVWVTGKCGNAWHQGNTFYGTISPNGAYELNATCYGNPPKIKALIGIRVYLEVKVKS